METENKNLGDKVIADLSKEFVAVGKHHVHNWYAYAIIGIVFGMAIGIIYVSNQSLKFDPSSADTGAAAAPVQLICPFTDIVDVAVEGSAEVPYPAKDHELAIAWQEKSNISDEAKAAYSRARAAINTATNTALADCNTKYDSAVKDAKAKGDKCDVGEGVNQCSLHITPKESDGSDCKDAGSSKPGSKPYGNNSDTQTYVVYALSRSMHFTISCEANYPAAVPMPLPPTSGNAPAGAVNNYQTPSEEGGFIPPVR